MLYRHFSRYANKPTTKMKCVIYSFMKSYKIVSATWRQGSDPTLTPYPPKMTFHNFFPYKMPPFTEMVYPVYGMCRRHVLAVLYQVSATCDN